MAGRPRILAKTRAFARIDEARTRGDPPLDFETVFQEEIDKINAIRAASPNAYFQAREVTPSRDRTTKIKSMPPITRELDADGHPVPVRPSTVVPIVRPRIEAPLLADLLGGSDLDELPEPPEPTAEPAAELPPPAAKVKNPVPAPVSETLSVAKAPAPAPTPKTLPAANIARLDAVGIAPIAELAAAGKTLREIAAQLKLSAITLARWVKQNPDRQAEFAEAERIGAQYWDDEAQRVLEGAIDATTLARAKELASHYRWRAKAMDGSRYADKQSVDLQGQVRLSADQIEARLLALVGTLPIKLPVSEQ